ncbi:hypothetical protein AALP_AA4G028800 [Arabis alpina]|uniref:Uncharacterized protein n=1 Tax=Arabis alpina TaxID=50452 RepID=A0A087H0S3_ARAAL|nr:hypothetical protein AALP_AA4G028800 [Arabis alpina]
MRRAKTKRGERKSKRVEQLNDTKDEEDGKNDGIPSYRGDNLKLQRFTKEEIRATTWRDKSFKGHNDSPKKTTGQI